MDYAIIRLGGKQYRVREGEYARRGPRSRPRGGKSFSPDVLLGDDGVKVTAKVLAHERGPKILIGKYRKRTGYKRHNGFRAATSRDRDLARCSEERCREEGRAEADRGGHARACGSGPPRPPPKPTTTSKGMPSGYEELTVAAVSDGAKTWNRPMLEAALEYEQAHAARKGAIAALESALKAKEEDA